MLNLAHIMDLTNINTILTSTNTYDFYQYSLQNLPALLCFTITTLSTLF